MRKLTVSLLSLLLAGGCAIPPMGSMPGVPAPLVIRVGPNSGGRVTFELGEQRRSLQAIAFDPYKLQDVKCLKIAVEYSSTGEEMDFSPWIPDPNSPNQQEPNYLPLPEVVLVNPSAATTFVLEGLLSVGTYRLVPRAYEVTEPGYSDQPINEPYAAPMATFTMDPNGQGSSRQLNIVFKPRAIRRVFDTTATSVYSYAPSDPVDVQAAQDAASQRMLVLTKRTSSNEMQLSLYGAPAASPSAPLATANVTGSAMAQTHTFVGNGAAKALLAWGDASGLHHKLVDTSAATLPASVAPEGSQLSTASTIQSLVGSFDGTRYLLAWVENGTTVRLARLSASGALIGAVSSLHTGTGISAVSISPQTGSSRVGVAWVEGGMLRYAAFDAAAATPALSAALTLESDVSEFASLLSSGCLDVKLTFAPATGSTPAHHLVQWKRSDGYRSGFLLLETAPTFTVKPFISGDGFELYFHSFADDGGLRTLYDPELGEFFSTFYFVSGGAGIESLRIPSWRHRAALIAQRSGAEGPQQSSSGDYGWTHLGGYQTIRNTQPAPLFNVGTFGGRSYFILDGLIRSRGASYVQVVASPTPEPLSPPWKLEVTDPQSAYTAVIPTQDVAQTFRAPENGTMTQASFYLAPADGPSSGQPVTVKVYPTERMEPYPELAIGTCQPTGEGWYTVTFSVPVYFYQDDEYVFVLSSGANMRWYARENPAPLSSGELRARTNGGSWESLPTLDAVFKFQAQP